MKDELKSINFTENYAAFWGGPFSNFYPCKIHVTNDWWDKPVDLYFNSSEQYFMWLKATNFKDQEIADKILEAKTPKEAKALGRKVRGFDDNEWAWLREMAMWNAVYTKFSQNEKLREFLLSQVFDNKHFVEGSPYDKIWGVGISWDDPAIADEKNWKGENLLGKTLDKVRMTLIEEKQ